ncbi:MAG: cytochrome b [Actinomycetota bacterium]
MSGLANGVEGAVTYVDDRTGVTKVVKKGMSKVFPDHWSFMLGEIALYSFIILLLSGTFLSLFFKPSQVEVIYNGSYVPLQGISMSEAYASTVRLSWDIRGGLVMRQIHHWAALIFVAAIAVHMMRIFFTGAFRKPRELNWLIGVGLLTLALLEGFAGYSLPDDLLSGTGLRIAEGVLLSIPVVGTYLSFFAFGGEFPGADFISRLYIVHVLLVPGIILALITVHLMLLVLQKHTQWPGPGRTESNVVGYPLYPVYTAKAGGFFFVVFGVTALMGGFVQINPIWLYGPYIPSQITAGAQPDWYIGFLEGGLRMFPNWEFSLWGYTLTLNPLMAGLIIPGVMFTALGLYPFLEAWVTGDRREHHLLDRPRNHPVRTGLGVMGATFYAILLVGGGNDLIAVAFGLSVQSITWALRILIFVLPVLTFIVTKRICLGLQRRDRDLLLHGRETGVVQRLPNGEYLEVHAPISAEERAALLAHEVQRPAELPPAYDETGIPRRTRRLDRVRVRLNRWYFGDLVAKPSPAELEAAQAHAVGHGPEATRTTPELEPGRAPSSPE